MRVFFGFFLPEEVKQRLSCYQQQFQKVARKGNFTRYQNLHLTLRFIGEVNPKELQTLKAILAQMNAPEFELSFGSFDQFKRHNKAIVYASVKPNPLLLFIYDRLVKDLKEANFKVDDERYTPHITLGREIELESSYSLNTSEKLDIPFCKIKELALIESTRIDNVLTYRPIQIIKLSKEETHEIY